MKEKMYEYSEAFLDYLFDVRGYSETSIITYEIALRQMMEVSHCLWTTKTILYLVVHMLVPP